MREYVLVLQDQTHRIAYFISDHGFGHAARACAIMSAMGKLDQSLVFDLFTTVPEWFFSQSLDVPYHYHSLTVDVGLVQSSPVTVDIPASLRALAQFTPFTDELLDSLAAELRGMHRVVADISPLGLVAARHAGIPSVLVENFTWNWIYTGFDRHKAEFAPFIEYFHQCFEMADFHVQTEPVCMPLKTDLRCGPISRAPRLLPEQLKPLLEIPEDSRMVLVSLGGIPLDDTSFVEHLVDLPEDLHVVIPGAAGEMRQLGQIHLLPRHNPLYHPDLVHASDWVVGKLGYSTVAEVSAAGCGFLYLDRPGFREAEVMRQYVANHLPSRLITDAEFARCGWLEQLQEDGWQLPSGVRDTQGGAAAQVARFIMQPGD